MAVLPPTASYTQFCEYVCDLRGVKTVAELDDLWAWRQKLSGLRVITGAGFRDTLPADERHLSREERGRKTVQEARANGRNIERLPDKAQF